MLPVVLHVTDNSFVDGIDGIVLHQTSFGAHAIALKIGDVATRSVVVRACIIVIQVRSIRILLSAVRNINQQCATTHIFTTHRILAKHQNALTESEAKCLAFLSFDGHL